MPRVAGYNCGPSGLCDLRRSFNRDLELARNPFLDFLLHMEVFVNGRTLAELVMSERHVVGMEVSASPSRKLFPYWELSNVTKGMAFP
jgi:hypothetical protein